MTEQGRSTAEAMFEKALDVAEKHLDAAVREGGPLGIKDYLEPHAMKFRML